MEISPILYEIRRSEPYVVQVHITSCGTDLQGNFPESSVKSAYIQVEVTSYGRGSAKINKGREEMTQYLCNRASTKRFSQPIFFPDVPVSPPTPWTQALVFLLRALRK